MTKNLFDIDNCGLPANNVFQCPPINAKPYQGMLFRFGTDEKTVVPCDTQALAKISSRFRNNNANNYEVLCQGSGLSSFLTIQDAVISLKRRNKASKGAAKKFKSIHKLLVNSGDGIIKATPSNSTVGHHTFWPVLDFNYLENAEIVPS